MSDSRDILEHTTPMEIVQRLFKRSTEYETAYGDHLLMRSAAQMILALERQVKEAKAA